jgi:hypothetical protein
MKNGDVMDAQEFQNGHRGGFIIWDWMEKRYLPYDESNPDILKREFSCFITNEKDRLEKFWSLAYDKDRVPLHQRITLLHTCITLEDSGGSLKNI